MKKNKNKKNTGRIRPDRGSQLRAHTDPFKNLSILSFGYAKSALREKHMALARSGCHVASSSDFRAVRALIRRDKERFQFFLIGPNVPDDERKALSDLYRTNYPRGNVIFFYRASIRNCERATALLNERGSPANLLAAIGALSTATKMDELVGER
jgi:hypothetical protein